MKNIYSLKISLFVGLLLGIRGFFPLAAFAQTTSPPSVEALEHYFDNAQAIQQKPLRHLAGTVLNGPEMHTIGTLTTEERKNIDPAADPPAIGVVRDLGTAIRFNLDETDIPSQGETSVAGGRLVRVNADTLVWTTCIKSEGAEELRINFSEGNFPAGVQVNLFSKDNYAFRQAELNGRIGEFGLYTTTTFADYVNIEVVIPASALGQNLFFVIPRIVHAIGRPAPDAPNVDCFEDVNCGYANGYANIGALKASTSQLSFVVGGGYYICSGNLLNDIRAVDLQPFLLTANHCFSSQASAASLEARFDMFTTSCNGGTNPNIILINGSNLLSTNSQSDFTLVLLNDNPGGYRWYLGWTPGGVANDETLHSVNHPGGIPQKYIRMLNKTSPDFTCGTLPPANFHYTRALGGETVGGSSGGNVVLPNGQVVGQLYGWCYLNGATECNYPSYYNIWGKFEVSYNNNNLAYWLYNGGSSVSMSVSPASSVNFGTGNVNWYYYQYVTVTNNGYAPYYLNLEAGSSYIGGTDPSQFTIIGGSYLYLDPGTSGTITVRFNPTSAGAKTATLNIPNNSNNLASPAVIALSGSAEPCSDIIYMFDGGAANARTFSKSGTGLWYTSWASTCGFICPGSEQIYSFVAPYTGYYSVEVTATNNMWVDYMWKEATCDGTTWNCFDDVYSPGTYGSAYFTAGNTYYILADPESTLLSTHTFCVFFNPCLNIIPIAGTGVANTQTYEGGGNGGWFTNAPATCGFYCPGVENVYSFVAPYTGYYSLQVTSNAGYYVDYFWKTSCGSTGWNCIQDVYFPGQYGAMYWTAGTTYYILADDENTGGGAQTFYINDPDPCRGIISLACNQSVSFGGGGPGVWNNNTCFWSTGGTEQVYSFVAPSTGQYSLQVSAANGWVDYMWSTSCAGPWNCISDISGTGQFGTMSWTAGTTYYIMLDDEDNGAGIHTFSLVCPELCHACAYDFLMYPAETWQTASSSIESSGCKMHKFYAYAGAKYTFKTGCGDGAGADYDTYLELLDASCLSVAFNDDGCGYPLSKIDWTAPATGYYYLKVRGYLSNAGSYTLAYNVCYGPPAQPGTISGPSTVGSGDPQVFTIADIIGATSYTWTYSGTGSVAGSGTSATLTATGDGTLSVEANNLCGTSLTSYMGITVIPLTLPVVNLVIPPGSTVCYAASQTITVAGGGTYFYVLNSGSATFVAGQNILFMPGTTVYPGGYLYGYISMDGNYCVPVVSKSADNGLAGTGKQVLPDMPAGDSFFKVYPNPTSGDFTLELSVEPAGSVVKVQCYNLLGAMIMEKEFISGKYHEMTLGPQAPGLYLLKVVQQGKTGMQKVIRK
jgi:hypothetical protein